MNYMLCRNRVRNFDHWKGVFDSHADAHRAAGLKLVHLWYELNSPRNIFFLFEVEDMERARAFLDSSDAAASERQSGLIEGDFRFFSPSLGYGSLGESESRAFAEADRSASAMPMADDSSHAEVKNSGVLPEPGQMPESEKTTPPEKGPESERTTPPEKRPESEKTTPPEKRPESEKTTPPEKGPESEKTTPPEKRPESEKATPPEKSPSAAESGRPEVKSSTPPATMKGPERAKSAQPLEPFEGWQPVENWPPAEAAAEATPEPPRHRGRWQRMKY
jgi:hypothetical protein